MPVFTTPPGTDDLIRLAEQALLAIPPRLRRHVADVGIVVEDMPDDETLAAVELDSPWDLTGLYRGTPWGRRSVSDPPRVPDTIHLFREPILLEWIETGDDLAALVRTVLIHEIAHHFGFSDAEIEQLERE